MDHADERHDGRWRDAVPASPEETARRSLAAPPPRPTLPPTLGERLAEARLALADAVAGGVPRALAAVAVVAVLALAAWWLLRPPPPPVEQQIPMVDPAAADLPAATGADGAEPGGGGSTGAGGGGAPEAAATTDAPAVVVHAAGAVARPGVYRLAAGARVADLVAAAGGLAPEADGARINLAAPVADGERVYVPRVGEAGVPSVVAGGGAAMGGPTGALPGSTAGPPVGVVDINTATATELEALPGVGPATAAAIVAHRTEHGPFATVDDLLEVRGIGEAKLEAMRAQVTV